MEPILEEASQHQASVNDPTVCSVCDGLFPCLTRRLADVLGLVVWEYGFTDRVWPGPHSARSQEEAAQEAQKHNDQVEGKKFYVVRRSVAGTWHPDPESPA